MFVYKLSGCRFKSICWQFVPNLRFFSKGLRYSNSQQSFRNTFRPIFYAMSSLAELTRYCQWDTKRLKLHFLYTSFCFLLCRTSFTAKNHQNTKIIKIQKKKQAAALDLNQTREYRWQSMTQDWFLNFWKTYRDEKCF